MCNDKFANVKKLLINQGQSKILELFIILVLFYLGEHSHNCYTNGLLHGKHLSLLHIITDRNESLYPLKSNHAQNNPE